MKKTKYYIFSSVILTLLIIAFSVFAEESNDTKAEQFLAGYGWEINKKSIDKGQIIIPEPFDLVYENYNELQLEAGLDLRPYMGRHGVRYTYDVTNYPFDVGEPVRANVIIVDGKCIGGDICTVSLEGFMHSLAFRPSVKTSNEQTAQYKQKIFYKKN